VLEPDIRYHHAPPELIDRVPATSRFAVPQRTDALPVTSFAVNVEYPEKCAVKDRSRAIIGTVPADQR